MHFDYSIQAEYNINFGILDIPSEKFIFGAEAYLKLRKKRLNETDIYYASNPITYGIPTALRELFYDYHSLMNN